MKHLNAFATVFAAMGAWLGLIFGPADGLIITMLVFAVLDYITGIVSAIINKTLSSRVGFVGIAKKVLIFAIVAVGNLIDVYILGGNAVLRTSVIFFYLANEGLSILENVGECGLPFPRRLKNILTQLRKKSEEENDNDESV